MIGDQDHIIALQCISIYYICGIKEQTQTHTIRSYMSRMRKIREKQKKEKEKKVNYSYMSNMTDIPAVHLNDDK